MKRIIPIALLLVTVLMAGCNLGGNSIAPTVDIAPTLDAARTQAAETVVADIASQPTATSLPATATEAATATELPAPTETATLAPVNTVAPLPTATKTYAPAPAATATATDYNCTITSASPAYNSQVSAGYDFDGKWTLKNTGSKSWPVGDMDFKYLSGEKMQKFEDAYDIPETVDVGDSVDFTLDLLAPETAGTYTMVWGLVYASRTVCQFGVTITVK